MNVTEGGIFKEMIVKFVNVNVMGKKLDFY